VQPAGDLESQIIDSLEPQPQRRSSGSLVPASSADVDQNFADGAALDGIVRVRRPLERKAVEWKPDVLSDFERVVCERTRWARPSPGTVLRLTAWVLRSWGRRDRRAQR
jgi:hypothetical protein